MRNYYPNHINFSFMLKLQIVQDVLTEMASSEGMGLDPILYLQIMSASIVSLKESSSMRNPVYLFSYSEESRSFGKANNNNNKQKQNLKSHSQKVETKVGNI